LKPRSVDEPVGAISAKTRASPFGDARPRDETKYSRPADTDKEAQVKYEAPQAPPPTSNKSHTPPSGAAADAPWPRGQSPEITKKSERNQSRQNPPKNQTAKAKGKADAGNLFDSLSEERA